MKERRYQAFVSSTYTDLIEERKEVTQAILENNCFPAGMELFPAANQSQWEFIKKVIKESDFYIVIIAGRYGSIGKDKEGKKVSYTEREFDYACSLKKPIIVLLRNNIEELPVSKCETTADKNAKLKKFRDKAQNGRLIKYWRTPGELHAAVGLSIRNLVEDSDNKMVGWIRADQIENNNDLNKSKDRELLGQEFCKMLDECYDLARSYRDATHANDVNVLKKTIQNLKDNIEKIFYFGERYSIQEPAWAKMAVEIKEIYNKYFDHCAKYARRQDKNSMGAMKAARKTEIEYNVFLKKILETLNTVQKQLQI